MDTAITIDLKSQSLQISSVISIMKSGEVEIWNTGNVAIPSNQVGNFHLPHAIAAILSSGIVAIPSNQVGNFHPTPPCFQAGRRL